MAWREREDAPEEEQWWNQPDIPPPPVEEPEADPNAWLYDPNTQPTMAPPIPGHEWFWTGSQWSLRNAPSNNPAPLGPPNPYDPNDPHYQYGPGTLGGEFVSGDGGGGGGGGWGGGPTSAPPQLRPLSDYYQNFNAPVYGGFPAFSYEAFSDPTEEDVRNMPGFKFAVDEGIKRLGNERAARGTYLGGPTLKAIGSWVTDYGMQSYGNLRDQKLSTYNTNRGNAADAWMKNYGVSRDTFDRNYRGAYDSNQVFNRGAEMQFNRDMDLYNAWRDDQKFLINQGNY